MKGSRTYNFSLKLGKLKAFLKHWNKHIFWNILAKNVALKLEMNFLEKKLQSNMDDQLLAQE